MIFENSKESPLTNNSAGTEYLKVLQELRGYWILSQYNMVIIVLGMPIHFNISIMHLCYGLDISASVQRSYFRSFVSCALTSKAVQTNKIDLTSNKTIITLP